MSWPMVPQPSNLWNLKKRHPARTRRRFRIVADFGFSWAACSRQVKASPLRPAFCTTMPKEEQQLGVVRKVRQQKPAQRFGIRVATGVVQVKRHLQYPLTVVLMGRPCLGIFCPFQHAEVKTGPPADWQRNSRGCRGGAVATRLANLFWPAIRFWNCRNNPPPITLETLALTVVKLSLHLDASRLNECRD